MIYFSLKVETVLVCDSFDGMGSYGVFVYLCICVFVYLCICIFVYLCVFVFVFLFSFMNRAISTFIVSAAAYL